MSDSGYRFNLPNVLSVLPFCGLGIGNRKIEADEHGTMECLAIHQTGMREGKSLGLAAV
jgi:hypothetical protein